MTFSFPWRTTARVPSFLFVTHAKAGSTWIDNILRTLFGEQVERRFGRDLTKFQFRDGRIYSAVFMTWDEFQSYPELAEVRRFAVIRDLRDTLVSRYFSMRYSHVLDAGGEVGRERAQLEALSLEDGLMLLLEKTLGGAARIHKSWLGSGEIVLRYEDLIANDRPLFTDLLIGKLQLPISAEQLEKAVVANRFETVFKRQLGEEDASSHGRKGMPGDWRNHFTPALAQRFQEKFGDVLIAGGYEKSGDWVGGVRGPAV